MFRDGSVAAEGPFRHRIISRDALGVSTPKEDCATSDVRKAFDSSYGAISDRTVKLNVS